ncbi:MAG: hypothetical protein KAJ62_11025 [Desulfobacteraceae bacterium]|nr:hypothetical protein [Desulfobacteraceae bacterium]
MRRHLQNKTLKFIFIIMISTIIAVLLHQIHNDPLMNLNSKTQSLVVTSGLFPPIAFFALVMTFGIIGLIFIKIQKNLWGSKIRKGMVFGIAMSGVWIIGMTEAHVLFSLSLFGEIYTGFADSCGILVMCLLLGKHFADDTPTKKIKPKTRYISILIIAAIYLLVRYFSYSILNIESAYITNPFGTFIWTAAMGTWIGIMYAVMDMNIYQKIPFKHALLFGGLIFGLQWIIFNLFALLFVVVPVSDLLFRSVFDILAIILGVYFYRKHSIQKSAVF